MNLQKREQLEELLGGLNCELTYRTVSQERRILSNYGGGCHQKIGVSVLERAYGQIQSIRGLTEGGKRLKTWGLSHRRISSTQKVRPCDPRKNRWFDRVPVPLVSPSFDRPLWVAREMALPPHSVCHHLIWARWDKNLGETRPSRVLGQRLCRVSGREGGPLVGKPFKRSQLA